MVRFLDCLVFTTICQNIYFSYINNPEAIKYKYAIITSTLMFGYVVMRRP